MKGKRAFLYVQHLLGIGHLRRAVTLANALAGRGFGVTLASGGFPVPDLTGDGMRDEVRDGVRFVQLPPAGAADSTFKVLIDGEGNPIDESWKSKRREILHDAWRTADAHALVLELYPFGRRQMRFELIPLLESAVSAGHRPLIACSVRDVLGGGQKNVARQDEMLELFERYFDRLLVHGDPSVIAFSRTFRHADRLSGRLHYTGYMVDVRGLRATDMQSDGPPEDAEVIVSAGGGAVGMRLLEAAIGARPHTGLANRTWRVLGGVNAAAADLATLSDMARAAGQGRIIVERARPDFPGLLAGCAVSVSQGGYNTMIEAMQARARTVVVPFAGGGETEQTLRARSFADRGLIEMVEEDALTPLSLAAAIDRSAGRPRPAADRIDLGGAERSAALLASWTSELKW